MTTYEEWRVTGTPLHRSIEQTYSNEDFTDPEETARWYASAASAPRAWKDGPHLHKRTVTVTDWEDVADDTNHPHPTCVDVTRFSQPPRSEWKCGPDCPRADEHTEGHQ